MTPRLRALYLATGASWEFALPAGWYGRPGLGVWLAKWGATNPLPMGSEKKHVQRRNYTEVELKLLRK